MLALCRLCFLCVAGQEVISVNYEMLYKLLVGLHISVATIQISENRSFSKD